MWWLGLVVALIFGLILGFMACEGYNSEPFQSFLNQIFHPWQIGAIVTLNSTLNSTTLERCTIENVADNKAYINCDWEFEELARESITSPTNHIDDKSFDGTFIEPTISNSTDLSQNKEIIADSKSIIISELNSTQILFNFEDKINPVLDETTKLDRGFSKLEGKTYFNNNLKISIPKLDTWKVKTNTTQSSLQNLLVTYNPDFYLGSVLVSKDNSTGVSVFGFNTNSNITISNLIEWELKEIKNDTDSSELLWFISGDKNNGQLNLKSNILQTEEDQFLLKIANRIYSIHSLTNVTESIDEQYGEELEEIIEKITFLK